MQTKTLVARETAQSEMISFLYSVVTVFSLYHLYVGL